MEDSFIYKFALFVSNVAFISPIVPIILVLIVKTRAHFNLKWALFALLLGGFILDLISKFYFRSSYYTQNIKFNIYTILCLVISIIIFDIILGNKGQKKIAILCFSTILAGLFIVGIYYRNLNIDSSLAYTLFSLIVIIFSFIYFKNLLNEMKVRYILRHSYFWIISAFLVYFGGTLALTLFQEYVANGSVELILYLWPIQGFAYIIFTFLIAKSIWTMRKT